MKSLVFSCLMFLLNLSVAYADIVQTVRGEFHNGVVLQDKIQLKTNYGFFSFPKDALKQLSRTPEYDEIITNNGERLRGEIIEKFIRTTRQLGPDLEIALTDISLIQFSKKDRHGKIEQAAILEMNDGDVVLVSSVKGVIELETSLGIKRYDPENIQLLDVSFSEDKESFMARLQLNSGKIEKGILSNSTIDIEPYNGDAISLSVEHIALIMFNQSVDKVNSRGRLFPNSYMILPQLETVRDRFVDGWLGPEMVILPKGSYYRGQVDGDFDEKPVQEVVIKKPFAISRYEVTFSDYEKYCLETSRELPDDSEWGRGLRPVINVSWEEATAYIKWLSIKTGKKYRLPSDAEWEYAARAGAPTKFPWGNEVGEEKANCAGCMTIWGSERTARVGRFEPNGFGLFDMGGNVFEWTQDCWNTNYKDIGLEGSSYENPAGCGKRVIRGGAWSFPPKEVRSANRWRDFPTRRSDDTGFRVVRELN